MTAITLTEAARCRLIDLAARRWAQLTIQLAGADAYVGAPWPLSWYDGDKTTRARAIRKFETERAELRSAILTLSGKDDLPEPDEAAFLAMRPVDKHSPAKKWREPSLHYNPGGAKREQARLVTMICTPPKTRDPDVGFGPVFNRLLQR